MQQQPWAGTFYILTLTCRDSHDRQHVHSNMHQAAASPGMLWQPPAGAECRVPAAAGYAVGCRSHLGHTAAEPAMPAQCAPCNGGGRGGEW
jgi:hypothetical protein